MKDITGPSLGKGKTEINFLEVDLEMEEEIDLEVLIGATLEEEEIEVTPETEVKTDLEKDQKKAEAEPGIQSPLKRGAEETGGTILLAQVCQQLQK